MTSAGSSPAIRAFFDAFEQASSAGDWARYESMFLPSFLSLDPAAAVPVERERLIAFLPQRHRFFAAAGVTGISLSELSVTDLDERHAVARTTWRADFGPARDPVELRSTFLLRRDDEWRIAVYLNHDVVGELLAAPASGRAPRAVPDALHD